MAGSVQDAWVVLTMGDRNDDLGRAVESIGVAGGDRIVIVANGTDPEPIRRLVADLSAELAVTVDVAASPRNVGIPAGRNLGFQHAADAGADVVFFLDDDARVLDENLVADTIALFSAEPTLGVVGFRIVDPATGRSLKRHVPRLGGSRPHESGEVAGFLGGACAVRTRSFAELGGYDPDFFYAMEETDLALRAVDRGWRIRYCADLRVAHPPTAPVRHEGGSVRTARNRVVLARKNLPGPVALLYVLDWALITAVRARSWPALRAWWQGTRAGCGATVARDPIAWRTVLRLTRLGRPPVV